MEVLAALARWLAVDRGNSRALMVSRPALLRAAARGFQCVIAVVLLLTPVAAIRLALHPFVAVPVFLPVRSLMQRLRRFVVVPDFPPALPMLPLSAVRQDSRLVSLLTLKSKLRWVALPPFSEALPFLPPIRLALLLATFTAPDLTAALRFPPSLVGAFRLTRRRALLPRSTCGGGCLSSMPSAI